MGGHLLVVDYGKIMHPDGSTIGFLFEDGLIRGHGEPLGKWDGEKAIEELTGAVFQGIDSHGLQQILPGPEKGPIGGLKYNNREFQVLFGRVATMDHKLMGRMTDDGTLYFRDPRFPTCMRKMDVESQLSTQFQGIKSNGQPWRHDYLPALHKPDKPYWENEVNRYFLDIDRVNGPQKKYVFDTMRLYSVCGLLHMISRKEGRAGLGNVKHGASGVTAIRTGNVTLDREEFEREVNFFKKFGSLMAVPARTKPLIEVRLNMVVSHEYGHQLEFWLSEATKARVTEIYEKRIRDSQRLYPIPEEAETLSELIQPHQIEQRIFISGYARSSFNEYWAECVAAFAIKESRTLLKQCDLEIHEILKEVVMKPEQTLSALAHEHMLNLQTSLRVGGEFPDDLLNQ